MRLLQVFNQAIALSSNIPTLRELLAERTLHRSFQVGVCRWRQETASFLP